MLIPWPFLKRIWSWSWKWRRIGRQREAEVLALGWTDLKQVASASSSRRTEVAKCDGCATSPLVVAQFCKVRSHPPYANRLLLRENSRARNDPPSSTGAARCSNKRPFHRAWTTKGEEERDVVINEMSAGKDCSTGAGPTSAARFCWIGPHWYLSIYKHKRKLTHINIKVISDKEKNKCFFESWRGSVFRNTRDTLGN